MKTPTKAKTLAEMIALGVVPNTGKFRRAAETERVAQAIAAQLEADREAFDAMTDEEKKPIIELRNRQARNAERRATRTKGKAFSRCRLVSVHPGAPEIGQPGAFTVEHPTRGKRHTIAATVETMRVFMPSAPKTLRAAMLGREGV